MRIKDLLQQIYNDNIAVRITGSSIETIKYDIGKKCYKARFIVVINENYSKAVVWKAKINQQKNYTLKRDWDKLLKDNREYEAYYRKNNSNEYEKILICTLDFLEKNIYVLEELLKINCDDNESKQLGISADEFKYDFERKRYSTSRYERDRKFSCEVLKRYGYRCAICRSDIREILQAAHIIAVKDRGRDNPENGICLCANHHLMYDSKLIDININNCELIIMDQKLKETYWFRKFVSDYGSKIISPYSPSV